MAFVLTPEGSVSEWLAELDSWLARSPGFFSGRAVVLDLSAMAPANACIVQLIAALEPNYVLLGGGNVERLGKLPPKCRRGDNADAFTGGFRLWDEKRSAAPKS